MTLQVTNNVNLQWKIYLQKSYHPFLANTENDKGYHLETELINLGKEILGSRWAGRLCEVKE